MRPRTLAVLLLLGAAACQSESRMWRISPLSGSGAQDPERFNGWPLAYHSGGATSVLWPLFDMDDRGFALRPLVAKDDSRWSVLYPLASIDAETGKGWAGLYYSFENNQGVFPFYNKGKSLTWTGPVWWTDQSKGLFPLAMTGRFNYAGPVWWTKDAEGDVDGGGLFPVAMFGDLNYVGPAWWRSDRDSHGLFPLYAHGDLNWVGPVWWRTDETRDCQMGGLFPLFWSDAEADRLGVLPFYWHVQDEDSTDRYYLLGLGHTETRPELERSWVLPFWFRTERTDRSDTVLAPFFYRRTRQDQAHVFTLLGDRRVGPDSSGLNLYPLWWSSRDQDSSYRMLLPFFYYGKDGADRTLLTPLGGRGWSQDGSTRYVNFLGPLYHYSRNEMAQETRYSFLWPLVEYHREGDESTFRMTPLFRRTADPQESDLSLLAGLGNVHRGTEGSSFRLWPLLAHSTEPEAPDLLYHWTLYGHQRQGDASQTHLFPLFSGHRSEARSDYDFALGLGHYSRSGDGREWHLWPLVSSSTDMGSPGFLASLTLVGRSRWDTGQSFHVAGPLLFQRRTDDRADLRREKTRVLAFFTHEKEESRHDVPQGAAVSRRVRAEHTQTGFLFDWFKNERTRYRFWEPGLLSNEERESLRWWSRGLDPLAEAREQRDPLAAQEILAAHGTVVESTEPAAMQEAVADFARRHTVTVPRRHVRVPFLFEYERDGAEKEWDSLLWLVHSQEDERSSRFSFLYYGYRRETIGERTSRDIFPFLTYDTGPDERRFSFLWRLFRYERQGDKKGGHVLFIPWGEH